MTDQKQMPVPRTKPRSRKMPVRPKNYVTADYIETAIPGYIGNPFIAVLPEIVDKIQLHDDLIQLPLFNPSQRADANENRYHHILGLMEFYRPLARHYHLAASIDQIMRVGYKGRTPNSASFRKQQQENYARRQRGDYSVPLPRTAPPCECSALIGVSGGGKTATIIRTLNRYEQVVYHPKLKEKTWQIPWLRLECPHNGKITQLCSEFFARVDERLGTEYAQKYDKVGLSDTVLVDQVNTIATLHAIGIIIVDELQHIKPRTDLQIKEFLNFLVNLVNRSVVPILFVGTMACASLLQTTFRQARRSIGPQWLNYSKDEDWEFLMTEMWQYQWTRKPVPLTPAIMTVLFDETQGILDLAIKLFIFAQQHAIMIGKEQLSTGLLKHVAKERFSMVRPMLDALRSGIPARIAKYDDLSPLNFDAEWEKAAAGHGQALTISEIKQIAAAAKAAKKAAEMEAAKKAAAASSAETLLTGTPDVETGTFPETAQQPQPGPPPSSHPTPKRTRKPKPSSKVDMPPPAEFDELDQDVADSVTGTLLEVL